MSRAYDQGQDEAINNSGGALKPEDWHSLAYAEGWIMGLYSLIDNYGMTEYEENDWQTAEEHAEWIDNCIINLESDVEITQNLIDQVEGSTDNKNQIQKLCKTIESLKKQIDEMEEY